MLSLHATTDVATILEEVVEGVKAGHSYSQSSDPESEGFRDSSRRPSVKSGTSHNRDGTLDAESKHVEIDLDIELGDWTFATQPGALRRCFMNIFGNSLKYTAKGSITVSLRLKDLPARSQSKNHDGKLVIFQIADTGRDISANFLKSKIYRSFAQEDSLAPGTDLGLSLVRSIVAMLDGRIDIESRVGRGTVVTLLLPLMRPNENEGQSLQSAPMFSDAEQADTKSLEVSKITVAVCGINEGWRDSSLGSRKALYRVAKYIEDWFGMALIPWNNDPMRALVLIAEESDVLSVLEMFAGQHQAPADLNMPWTIGPVTRSEARQERGSSYPDDFKTLRTQQASKNAAYMRRRDQYSRNRA